MNDVQSLSGALDRILDPLPGFDELLLHLIGGVHRKAHGHTHADEIADDVYQRRPEVIQDVDNGVGQIFAKVLADVEQAAQADTDVDDTAQETETQRVTVFFGVHARLITVQAKKSLKT